MSVPMTTPLPHPWIERFQAEPAARLDELLSGLARILPYERATPSEILKRLFDGLPQDDADLRLLDDHLNIWLEGRWREWDADRRAAYGLPRFVTEYMDALTVIWLLELPETGNGRNSISSSWPVGRGRCGCRKFGTCLAPWPRPRPSPSGMPD